MSARAPLEAKYGVKTRSTAATSGPEPLAIAVPNFCTKLAAGINVTFASRSGCVLLNSSATFGRLPLLSRAHTVIVFLPAAEPVEPGELVELSAGVPEPEHAASAPTASTAAVADRAHRSFLVMVVQPFRDQWARGIHTRMGPLRRF